MAKFLSFFLALNDYIINSSTIREYNFVIETILVKSFAQAHVHTVHSTHAFSKCTLSQNCSHVEIRHSYGSRGSLSFPHCFDQLETVFHSLIEIPEREIQEMCY